jgi:hypothetical protein
MKDKNIILIMILLFSVGAVYGGDLDRVGTSGGTQLLIPVGARSIALGGASLGDVSGTEAIFWNPGGIASTLKSEVMFSNMQYIADIDVNYLAAVFNGGNIGAFGFHIKSLNFGDIEQTTEEEPDGTGITYSPSFIVTGLSYSRLLTDRISAGITGKIIHESIMQTGATTMALDLGLQYSFGPNLKLGVTMKNVGGKMKYSGRNLEETSPIQTINPQTDNGYFEGVALASDIPSVFSFGLMYRMTFNEQNAISLSGTFSNFNEASDQAYGGIEYGFKEMVFLRGGYNYEVQNADNQIFGASFGAGLKYPMGNFDIMFDYAFRQLTDYFDNSNIFTVKIGF